MPSNLNLQNTISWCGPYINYQPMMIGGPEPALSSANLVKQAMLGAPFTWRFNRSSAQFAATNVAQDYPTVINDFGFMEKVTSQNNDGTDIKEAKVALVLAKTKETARPKYVAAQYDDNNGVITFRLDKIPDQNYTMDVNYQRKSVPMLCLASTWAPIPDELSYIFNYGFLALNMALVNDPRFPIFNQMFTAHLLAAQDGLDETQRNLFLGNWLQITKEAARATLKTSQGVAAQQR